MYCGAAGTGRLRHAGRSQIGVEVDGAKARLAAGDLDGGAQGQEDRIQGRQGGQGGEIDHVHDQLGMGNVQRASGQRVHRRHRRVGAQLLHQAAPDQPGGAGDGDDTQARGTARRAHA